MNRFHVHLHVTDIEQSVGFYSRLFGAQPAKQHGDYAKWMLEDPPVNFAISTRGGALGIDHLGIQASDDTALAVLKGRAAAADADGSAGIEDEGTTTCCYARSTKHWVTDPQGVAWEQFHTLADIPMFHEAAPAAAEASASCALADKRRGKPLSVPVKAAGACC